MPRSVRWKGRSIRRPGAYTWHDLAGLVNTDLGVQAAIIVIGEAGAGEPSPSASAPVVHSFTDPLDMIETFQFGDLAEVARFAFKPLVDGQQESGVPLGGAETVYCIKTNQSTQASYTLQDGSSHNCITLKDRLWGTLGNNTWFKVTASGTGIYVTIGRDVAPNIGSQDSIVFSATGVDEWISVTYDGPAATATMSFDGTTFTTTTAGNVDDLSITCTGRTITELVNLINQAASGDYTAAVLRSDRASTLSTYMDKFSGVNIKSPTVGKAMGVAWDVTEWVNTYSDYCEATWVGGYEPQVYTQTYLSGGTLGSSSEANITDALKVAKRLDARFLATTYHADVGAVTLATINGHVATHCNQCNPVTGKAERQAVVCVKSTTKSALYSEVAAIGNQYVSAVNCQPYAEDENGTVEWLGQHCLAVAVAAAMAGSPVATPLTHKYFRMWDLRYAATDFDPGSDTDFGDAINHGVLMFEPDPGVGFRIAKGISTWVGEDNDMYILTECVEAQLWVARMFRRVMEKPQTGHKSKGRVTANDIRGVAIDLFRSLSDPSSPDFVLIEGTDPVTGASLPPYRNVRVSVSGDQVYLYAEVTFTSGINFIFNELRATWPSALAS